MIFQLAGFLNQIIRVDADAVPSYQTRIEFQKVPFGSGSFQHIVSIDTYTAENNGKLIHQGNIDITLSILNNLCRFSNFYIRCTMDARFYYKLIYFGHNIQSFWIATRNNLNRVGQSMHLFSRIDTLRRIAVFKIYAGFQSAYLFQNGKAVVFRTARIDRRFINYVISLL